MRYYIIAIERGRSVDNNLVVGLSCWIIQDGNYRDFASGERRAFALEFYAQDRFEKLDPAMQAVEPTLTYVKEANYNVTGKVAYVGDRWWVIDIGILAYRDEAPPSGLRQGDWIQGSIWIGIDPFFYFERLAALPDAPALIYDWEIERIEMLTAPFIEAQPNLRQRDPNKIGWKDVDRTDAWEDDGGDGEYLLHCRRLNDRIRKTLVDR